MTERRRNVKQFKAESKRLLDLMINSIYTNKEIFLRELLSNASDAIDKLYYQSLTDKSIKVNKKDLCIKIEIDKENRLLKIIDTGIGMNKEELENNLGMIAKSGSLQFKEENEKKKDVNIIGQFGVGFYSSFMVSDDVTVISKKYNEEDAYNFANQLTEQGFAGCVTQSNLWSNLNSEPYYVVTYGAYESEEIAQGQLANIQDLYGDAYVKFSGEYVGD